jgi:hypothetical protein
MAGNTACGGGWQRDRRRNANSRFQLGFARAKARGEGEREGESGKGLRLASQGSEKGVRRWGAVAGLRQAIPGARKRERGGKRATELPTM